MKDKDPEVNQYIINLCELCVTGSGGECHSPGCSMWMNRAPDIPLALEPAPQIYPEF